MTTLEKLPDGAVMVEQVCPAAEAPAEGGGVVVRRRPDGTVSVLLCVEPTDADYGRWAALCAAAPRGGPLTLSGAEDGPEAGGGPPDAAGDEYGALARFYAGLLDALAKAGADTDEVEEIAGDELEGSGWALRHGDSGWSAVPEGEAEEDDDDEDAVEMAGGEGWDRHRTRTGRMVWRKKVGKKWRYHYGLTAPGTAKTAAVERAKQGHPDHAATREKLARLAGAAGGDVTPHPSDRAAAGRALAGMARHHGGRVGARVADLADAVERALGELDANAIPPARREAALIALRRQAAMLHHMLGLAKEPWQHTAKEWADKHPSKLQKARDTVLRLRGEWLAAKGTDGEAEALHRFKAAEAAARAGILGGRADGAVGAEEGVSREHEAEVRKAVAAGKPVPEGVLRDYPDLQPKAAAKKEPWEMTRRDYEAKGTGLPKDHPLLKESEDLSRAEREIAKEMLKATGFWKKNRLSTDVLKTEIGAAAQFEPHTVATALKSPKVPSELKRKYREVKERQQAVSDAADEAVSHRAAVEEALAKGKPVPPEVLADYPDLAPKSAAAEAPAQAPAPAGEAPPEPGFTGTDRLGREWRDGKLVAKQEEVKPPEAAKAPEAAPPAPALPQTPEMNKALAWLKDRDYRYDIKEGGDGSLMVAASVGNQANILARMMDAAGYRPGTADKVIDGRYYSQFVPKPPEKPRAAPPAGTVPVPGNTYPHREKLKAMGGRWDPVARVWRVPAARADEANRLVGGYGGRRPPTPPAAPPAPPPPPEPPDRIISRAGRTPRGDGRPKGFKRHLGHGKRAAVERDAPKVGDIFEREDGPYIITGTDLRLVTDDFIEDMDAWHDFKQGPGWYAHFDAVPVERTPEEHAAHEQGQAKKKASADVKSLVERVFKMPATPGAAAAKDGLRVRTGWMANGTSGSNGTLIVDGDTVTYFRPVYDDAPIERTVVDKALADEVRAAAEGFRSVHRADEHEWYQGSPGRREYVKIEGGQPRSVNLSLPDDDEDDGDWLAAVGDDAPASPHDGKALADLYASLFSAIEDAGGAVTPAMLDEADDEIFGSGWVLKRDPSGGYYPLEADDDDGDEDAPGDDEDEGGVEMAGAEGGPTPVKYTKRDGSQGWKVQTAGGKWRYLKGDPTAAKAPKGKAAPAPAGPKAPADAAALRSLLEKHRGEGELTAAEKATAKRSLAALKRAHGDKVLDRVGDLADKLDKAAAKATPDKAAKLKAEARKLHALVDLLGPMDGASPAPEPKKPAPKKAEPKKPAPKKAEPKKPAPKNAGDPVADLVAAAEKAGGRDNLASMADLREALPHLSRPQFDAAVQEARRRGLLSAAAVEGRHATSDPATTRRHLDAGIDEDGQRLGFLSVKDGGEAPPAPAAPAKAAPKPPSPAAAPAPKAAPTAPVGSPHTPEEGKAFEDAYGEVREENRRIGGIVKIPDLYDRMRAKMPGLTKERAHDLLKRWMKEDKLTLQLCNDPRLEPRAAEGIRSSRGLLFYVQARGAGGVGPGTPHRQEAPPSGAAPDVAAALRQVFGRDLSPEEIDAARKALAPAPAPAPAPAQVSAPGPVPAPAAPATPPAEPAPAPASGRSFAYSPDAPKGKAAKAKEEEAVAAARAAPPARQRALRNAIRYTLDEGRLYAGQEDGLIEIPFVISKVRERLPDATPEEVHAELLRASADRDIALHVLNEVKSLRPQDRDLGIWSDDRMMYYADLRSKKYGGAEDKAGA